MLKRIVAIAALLCATIGLATFVNPGTAAAAGVVETYWYRYDDPNRGGGHAIFYPSGEHLRVHDFYADGFGTKAQMQKWVQGAPGGGGRWENHSTPCFDDSSTGGSDGTVDCNYSITDGMTVRIHIWSTNSGGAGNYSATTKA